ncbi:NAD(P)/FAD-dependent oxidoreductase [Phenylobacterium sp.]|jgi:NADH dehydrogenase|uniref:NAD(P)/FAD-dependent oxidoreductase n=1 Tax=Phenylobacterium sp. TaxID=1871053 RepID=UPI002E33F643|nr:FAD-dependent oxidoreductase [Phenylobacterium sp.]HEX2561729.1 FAD-dependent oxidoreductase [Phenylobacterium sp.]
MAAKRLLVLGGGFAGVWAALSAVEEARHHGGPLDVTLVSATPNLVLRPRLYQADPASLQAPLADTVGPVGACLLEGYVTDLDVAAQEVSVCTPQGEALSLPYDAVVLALGSVLRRDLPGAEHAYDVDSGDGAVSLDRRLMDAMAGAAPGDATFAIVGAGFTGLELATELRPRLAQQFGEARAAAARIVLVDGKANAETALGAGPAPAIGAALDRARVDRRFGRRVVEIGPAGLLLDDGEWIASRTVILSGGLQASPLTVRLGVQLDELGRAPVGEDLRVVGCRSVFAAGDCARALVDQVHVAPMSCQHAMPMGRSAGRNAARALLGLAPEPYRQLTYVTCLDLGAAGAVFTTGWERNLLLTGAAAKKVKRAINAGIRPPTGSPEEILAAARVRDDGRLVERLMAYAAA